MTTALLMTVTLFPFVISPGASFTITVSSVAAGDRYGPLKVWAGTSLGTILIATVVALTGLGTLIASNGTAQLVFGLLGGAILIAFGVVPAVRLIRRRRNGSQKPEEPQRALVWWSFLVVITNIKALSVYAFVAPTTALHGNAGLAHYAAFTGIHSVLILLWLTLVGIGMRHIPGLARSQRTQTVLILLASVTMIALGIRTIVDAFL